MQHLQLKKYGILETIGKDSRSPVLLNERTPSVLNHTEEACTKLATEINSNSSVYISLSFPPDVFQEIPGLYLPAVFE